jgi:hypothetical protein
MKSRNSDNHNTPTHKRARSPFITSMAGSLPQFHREYQRRPEENTKAFLVNGKIPQTAPSRSPESRRDRIRSLMALPSHRPTEIKFDASVMERT